MKQASGLILFNKLLFLLLLSACSVSRQGQTTAPERGELVFVDQSENGYILRGKRSLIKYNIRNIPVNRYDFDVSVWQTGMSTDLRFYAFNNDFQTFFILDQYLNEITQFSFSTYLDFMAIHPVLVNGHMIWLYNPAEHKLEKYTTQMELVSSSRNLNQDIPRLQVDQMIFHKNQIFLNDHHKGIYIFDFSGRLIRQIPLPRQTRDAQIDLSASQLFIYSDNQWHSLDLHQRILQPRKVLLPEELIRTPSLIFQNGKIYHWNTEALEIETFHFSL